MDRNINGRFVKKEINQEYMYYKMKGYNTVEVSENNTASIRTVSNWNKELRAMSDKDFTKLLKTLGIVFKKKTNEQKTINL